METPIKSDMLIRLATVLALFLVFISWVLFPLMLDTLGVDSESRGTFGDQFGSLNTLFTGLAFALLVATTLMQGRELKMQRNELELTRREFAASTDLQAANLSGSLVLPIFQYSRRKEIGAQLGLLANRWRAAAKDVLGEEAAVNFLNRFKEHPESAEIQQELENITLELVARFSELRAKSRQSEWDSQDQKEYYSAWDEARRNISIVAQQVHQIKVAELVPERELGDSNKVLRISAFPDFVSTYKYCVYPLDYSIEKGRRPDAETYPPGFTFINIYSAEELIDAFY